MKIILHQGCDLMKKDKSKHIQSKKSKCSFKKSINLGEWINKLFTCILKNVNLDLIIEINAYMI